MKNKSANSFFFSFTWLAINHHAHIYFREKGIFISEIIKEKTLLARSLTIKLQLSGFIYKVASGEVSWGCGNLCDTGESRTGIAWSIISLQRVKMLANELTDLFRFPE